MTRNPQTSPRIRRHVAKPTLPRRWAMVLALLLFALLPAARAHASRGAPSQVLRAVQSAGKSIVRAIEEEAPRVGIVAAREIARESGSQKQEGSTQVGRVAPASTGPMDATPCWIVLVVVAVAIPTGIAWAVRGNKRSQPLLDEDVAPPSTATSSVLPPRRVTMAPEPWRAPPTQPSPLPPSRMRRVLRWILICVSAVLISIRLVTRMFGMPLSGDAWAYLLLGVAFVGLVILSFVLLWKFATPRNSPDDPRW